MGYVHRSRISCVVAVVVVVAAAAPTPTAALSTGNLHDARYITPLLVMAGYCLRNSRCAHSTDDVNRWLSDNNNSNGEKQMECCDTRLHVH
jgi:hypothetical protein